MCSSLREAGFAEPLYQHLQPLTGRWMVFPGVTFGPVDRVLGALAGLVGRYDDGEQHLQAALAATAAVPAPLFHAEASYDYAELLLDRDGPGDRDRARDHLATCLETARRLELVVLEDRAIALQARLTGN